MSVPDELRNIRDHLRSGRFGQREVWEQQLEKAAVEADDLARRYDALMSLWEARGVEIERLHDARGEQDLEINKLRGVIEARDKRCDRLEEQIERLTKERDDYEAEGRRHIKTIAELRHEIALVSK